jgi:hypothetical protein
MKVRLRRIWPILGLAGAVGCNTVPLTTTLQPTALDYALKRARFDMNCPSAAGSVLTSETVQPALNGPLMMGTERAQYTIGVTGCGQRQTVQVICAQGGDGCFTATATP